VRPILSNRKTLIVFRKNAARKSAAKITDRAKRYRAHQKENRPDPPKWCNFCGRRRNVDIHHIEGDETDGSKDNLMWACRKCNVSIANLMRKNRIGKRTRQYNPAGRGSRKAMMDEYAAAIKVMRGQFDGDVGRAVATIRATPPDIRSAYTRRTWSTRRHMYGPSGRQSEIPF
jgi:hypothetical protein